MLIKKKTIFLISLVILLIIVGYINHQLTKHSLLNSSNEYETYEEAMLTEINSEITNEEIPTSIELESQSYNDESNNYENDIVDSKDSQVSQLTEDTNNEIEETINMEQNINSSNYFIEYRLSRDKLRANLIERLNEIINNEKTDENIREEAQKEIIRIGNITEKELYIEGLIKAKGFEDALIFLQDNSARVVVSENELTEQQVMQILEIVQSETKLDPSNIKIMKKF